MQIGAYGGEVVRLAAGERRARVRALVAAGWLPATSSDPALSGAGNPYGLDGYAAIADEIVEQLGASPTSSAYRSQAAICSRASPAASSRIAPGGTRR